jgi:hypothetical protein
MRPAVRRQLRALTRSTRGPRPPKRHEYHNDEDSMMNRRANAAKYDDMRDIWNKNKSSEIEFWRLLLSGRFPNLDWCEHVRMRLRDQRPLAEPLSGFAAQLRPALVEIIDVGSGPAPHLGSIHPSKVVRILMVDPLADEYNDLLRENGYGAYANIVGMEGENLSRDLPNNHFHIAYSRNALDHS